MVTSASLNPLLLTVDRLLTATGLDPAKVSDDDKVLIAQQIVEVAGCAEGVTHCLPVAA